jgi:hypothetical protein
MEQPAMTNHEDYCKYVEHKCMPQFWSIEGKYIGSPKFQSCTQRFKKNDTE